MKFPVDTSTYSFVAAGSAEADLDYGTKVQRKDNDGVPLYKVHLFAIGGGGRELITVRVSCEPKGLGDFVPVKVTGLVANAWTRGDTSGVSFRAVRVEPTGPSVKAA